MAPNFKFKTKAGMLNVFDTSFGLTCCASTVWVGQYANVRMVDLPTSHFFGHLVANINAAYEKGKEDQKEITRKAHKAYKDSFN